MSERRNKVSKNRFHGLWALTNRELKKWYQQPVRFRNRHNSADSLASVTWKSNEHSAMFSSTSFHLAQHATLVTQLQGLGLLC